MKRWDLRIVTSSLMFAALSWMSLPLTQASADADTDKGKGIYNGAGACSSCHGPEGKGDGAAAAALNPKPRNFAEGKFALDTDKDGKTGTEADLFEVISKGAAAFGGSPMMVGRPDLPEADRKAVVKYVLSLKK